MSHELDGVRIAILAADGVERVELEQPRGALYGAGATTTLLSIHPGEIWARQWDKDLPAFCPAVVEQFVAARRPVAS